MPACFRRLGDDDCQIYHGDSLKVLQTLPEASIDLLFADPPYNLGKDFAGVADRWPSEDAYLDWSYQWMKAALRCLKPAGSFYIMASTQYMPYFDLFLRQEAHILSRIVWHYDSSGVQARRYYGSLYEPILFGTKDRKNYRFNAEAIAVEAKTGAQRKLIDYRKDPPQPYNSSKVPGNVWYFPRVRYRMPEYCSHPSQKPEALLERMIQASSQPGDWVLDPFAGSFSTASVAQRLGRRVISIELSETYIEQGLARLQSQSS